MTSITVRAFAKINLSLKILSKRPDGFHDIETIMQNISLYDELVIENGENGIIVDCDDPDVPSGKANICYKAAELMLRISEKKGVKINIHKIIPSGAGLGGGSSDAAAVLTALNKLWKMDLPASKLLEIAAELGSDVPFFLVGGRALCRGRGEKVEKTSNYKLQTSNTYYVIVKPDVSVPTKWAYEEYDRMLAAARFSCFGSKAGGLICSESPLAHYENDFERVILPKHPGIKKAKDLLLSAGAKTALLTGSGSAVFGVADSKTQAEELLSRVREEYALSYLVHTVERSFEII